MQDLLRTDIPTLTGESTAGEGLSRMEDFRVWNLPVVEERLYLGLVNEDDLLDQDEASSVHAFIRPERRIFSRGNWHWLEAKRLMAEHGLSLVPVLDEDETYLGCITATDLLRLEGESLGLKQPGGVVVLRIHHHDYHLSEIAQIVESDDAGILTLLVRPLEDSGQLEVTLKVTKLDLGRILQTFRRYEYEIIASYHYSNLDLDLRERYDALMRFLNL